MKPKVSFLRTTVFYFALILCLMIAVTLNLPGNVLIGGGGGIGLIAGMSGLCPFPKYILCVSLAIAPLPILLLAGKLPA